jgi:hypothetical protein
MAQTLYAVRLTSGALNPRALPTKAAAAKIAKAKGGRVVIDPRSIQR